MRRLYRAERFATVGELAASVAHEIRNPMTAIRSTVQYLLREFDDGNPKRELVHGVIAEVDLRAFQFDMLFTDFGRGGWQIQPRFSRGVALRLGSL